MMRYEVRCFDFFGGLCQFSVRTNKYFWNLSSAKNGAKKFCENSSSKEAVAVIWDRWTFPATKIAEYTINN